jgi:thiamine-phosphate pyrophosphorylase
MNDRNVERIVDASLNRAGEGLRVVEDYVRFVLDDAHLTEQFKRLRHDLAQAAAAFPLPERHAARDVDEDVGTAISTPAEGRRADAWAVCAASLERAKQSLRSLEEFGKVAHGDVAPAFEALRYRLYTLEAALGRTVDAVERLAGVRLYVLVDGCDSENEFERLIEQLVAAGVGAIQLRDKRLGDRELVARARLLRRLTSPARTPQGRRSADAGADSRAEPGAAWPRPLAIINDRADVARIVDADGVHLGQDDVSVADARRVVGPRMLIGASTHSIEEARAAVLAGANYIGVGPTFPSATKSFDEFPGVELVRQVAREIRLPAFAIGGLAAENIGDVLAAGATRIAVGSAVTSAPSPSAAVAALRDLLGGAASSAPTISRR